MIYKIQFTLLFFFSLFFIHSEEAFHWDVYSIIIEVGVALHEPDATSNVLQLSLVFLFLLQIAYKPVFRIHDILDPYPLVRGMDPRIRILLLSS
jgi:hypothetical protein